MGTTTSLIDWVRALELTQVVNTGRNLSFIEEDEDVQRCTQRCDDGTQGTKINGTDQVAVHLVSINGTNLNK